MISTLLRKELFLEQVLKQIRPSNGAVYETLSDAYFLVEEDDLFEATPDRDKEYKDLLQEEIRTTLNNLIFGDPKFRQGLTPGSAVVRGVTTLAKRLPKTKPLPKPQPQPKPIKPPTTPVKRRKSKDGYVGVYLADEVDFVLEFLYLWILENADLYTLPQTKTKRKRVKVSHRIAA